MLKLVTCIKQVPRVTELPWNAKTGTLRRELAEGMINPACKNALEAALVLKHKYGAQITAITMGPESAEEILREAIAMGVDRGIMLCDSKMAGADTLATSYTLARAIETSCPDYDLILCGCHTSDSETAQVGPQLMEELDIPGVTYVEEFDIMDKTITMKRVSDNFVETLQMNMPGLVTVSTESNIPRYIPLSGVQDAFEDSDITRLSISELNLDEESIGAKGSPTKILNVYSPTTDKDNIWLTGAPKKIIEDLFDKFDDKIGGAIGKDIKEDDK